MKLGYLGPKGTFSEQAALKVRGDCEIVPYSTIGEVLESVDCGYIESGIVPVENSTEGSVNAAVDGMIFDTELFIQSQINISIEHNMMINKKSKGKKIIKILSHPQGLAQCRSFLRENYPDAETVSISSTAEAGKIVSETDQPWAAIGLESVAEIYGLLIIHHKIQDSSDNFTKFAVVSKNDTSVPVEGQKITVAFSTLNEPGQLYRLLNLFAVWDLNMTKIVSRPMRNKSDEYVFVVDLEGDKDAEDIKQCLGMLKRKTSFFKHLGSYPVYDYRCSFIH